MTHAPAAVPDDRVQIRSRFAEAEVSTDAVLTFPEGLPGYETSRAFVLMDMPDQAPLKVLHAVHGAEPCFVVVDPKSVLPSYRCELGATDRLRLEASDDAALVWLAVVMVDPSGEVAVNLRAPIVINADRMIGRQVLPNNGLYPLRHVIGRD